MKETTSVKSMLVQPMLVQSTQVNPTRVRATMFVSLTLSPSLNARIVYLCMTWITIWAILVLDFPLVSSVGLIGLYLSGSESSNSMILSALMVPFRYTDVGKIEFIDGQHQQVVRCFTLYAKWFLVIVYQSGERCLLWRDSCEESAYRQLIVMEKRRHYSLRQ